MNNHDKSSVQAEAVSQDEINQQRTEEDAINTSENKGTASKARRSFYEEPERRHMRPDPMMERHFHHERARAQKQKILLAVTAVFALFAAICIIGALVQGRQSGLASNGMREDFRYEYGEFFSIPQVSQTASSNGLPLMILGSALLICMCLTALALIRELPWISAVQMRPEPNRHLHSMSADMRKETASAQKTDPVQKEADILPAVPSASVQENRADKTNSFAEAE